MSVLQLCGFRLLLWAHEMCIGVVPHEPVLLLLARIHALSGLLVFCYNALLAYLHTYTCVMVFFICVHLYPSVSICVYVCAYRVSLCV